MRNYRTVPATPLTSADLDPKEQLQTTIVWGFQPSGNDRSVVSFPFVNDVAQFFQHAKSLRGAEIVHEKYPCWFVYRDFRFELYEEDDSSVRLRVWEKENEICSDEILLEVANHFQTVITVRVETS